MRNWYTASGFLMPWAIAAAASGAWGPMAALTLSAIMCYVHAYKLEKARG